MSAIVEHLLTRLEEISAEAVRATDPAASDSETAGDGGKIIRERGLLIEQLNQALAAATDRLGYSEWNRLVVIHHQGTRVRHNLEARRNEIAMALNVSARGRAFLDCVTGLAGNSHSPTIVTNA